MSDASWAIAENVVTVVCSSLLAYFVSPWCLLLLLNVTPANCQACQRADWEHLPDEEVLRIAPMRGGAFTADEVAAFCAGFRRCAQALGKAGADQPDGEKR